MQIEKNRENRLQIELKNATLILTLEVKGRGAYLVRVSLPPPVRGTRLRRRSPDISAQRSRRLAAPGRWGCACGAREPGAIHGELDGGALTHRRARAPASKPWWRRPAHSAGPPWPAAAASVLRREKGEGKNELGFEGRRVVVGFDPANRAGDRPIKIDGRDRASPPGLAGGPCGRGRGRRGGPIRRPGRWLSGLGPKERWPSRPRAGLLLGRLNSA